MYDYATRLGHLPLGLNLMWADMDKLPDDTYHAKASSRNARLIGFHLAWIVWVRSYFRPDDRLELGWCFF